MGGHLEKITARLVEAGLDALLVIGKSNLFYCFGFAADEGDGVGILSVKGCWYFNRSDWEEIAEFIVKKPIDLKKICSSTYSISEAETAFRLFDSGKVQKVVFVWDD